MCCLLDINFPKPSFSRLLDVYVKACLPLLFKPGLQLQVWDCVIAIILLSVRNGFCGSQGQQPLLHGSLNLHTSKETHLDWRNSEPMYRRRRATKQVHMREDQGTKTCGCKMHVKTFRYDHEGLYEKVQLLSAKDICGLPILCDPLHIITPMTKIQSFLARKGRSCAKNMRTSEKRFSSIDPGRLLYVTKGGRTSNPASIFRSHVSIIVCYY